MPKGKTKKNGGHSMYHNTDYSTRKISSSETTGKGSFEAKGGIKPGTSASQPGRGKPKY